MDIVFIALLFFTVLIVFPMPFEMRVFYNVLQNNGIASLWLGKMRVNLSKLKIEELNLVIRTKHKRIEKEIKISEKQIKTGKHMSIMLIKKLSFRRIDFFSRIGLDDAFKTAMVAGSISALISTFFAVIKNSRPHAEICVLQSQNFFEKQLFIAFRTRIFVSIFDVIISIIYAKIKTNKELKYERKQQRQQQD